MAKVPDTQLTAIAQAGKNGLKNFDAENLSPEAMVLKRYSLETADAQNGIKRMYPTFASGARAVIKVNGSKVAAALEVTWSVSIEHTELRTIDTQMPWELIPGQITVEASLRRLINPDRTAPGDHLFTVLQAALHTPTAEIEIRDRLGNPLFVAKGSFVSWQGQLNTGQLGIESVRFKGLYWRDNTQQSYNPAIQSLTAVERALEFVKRRAGALNALGAAAGA
jgi:hypothetical protein